MPPRRPPPRIPDAVMRWFPVASPPKSSHTKPLDWASYAVGAVVLVAGLMTGSVVFYGIALLIWVFAMWRAFLDVVHEQQLADWMNRPPNEDDVPPEEW